MPAELAPLRGVYKRQCGAFARVLPGVVTGKRRTEDANRMPSVRRWHCRLPGHACADGERSGLMQPIRWRAILPIRAGKEPARVRPIPNSPIRDVIKASSDLGPMDPSP